MYKYAQIDDTGRCVAVSDLSGVVDSPYMIALETADDVQLGDIYENGVWTRPEPLPQPEPEPTPEEIQAQTLLNTEFLVVMAELSNM